jgi:hypothetical protein
MDPHSLSKLDPHSLKKLAPDPHKVNADLKHCFKGLFMSKKTTIDFTANFSLKMEN